jgi:transposase
MMGPLNDPLKEPSTMTTVSIIGLDIAKFSFSVHGYDGAGRTVVKRALKRAQVLGFFAQLAPCSVALEACCSAHR